MNPPSHMLSLRAYLAGLILIATVPLAGLMSYKFFKQVSYREEIYLQVVRQQAKDSSNFITPYIVNNIPQTNWQNLFHSLPVSDVGVFSLWDEQNILRACVMRLTFGQVLRNCDFSYKLDSSEFEYEHTIILPRGWRIQAGLPRGAIQQNITYDFLTVLAICAISLVVGLILAMRLAHEISLVLKRIGEPKDRSLSKKHIAIREIFLLQQALDNAQIKEKNALVRLKVKQDLLENKVAEFEKLFNHSPIGLALALDTRCEQIMCNEKMPAWFCDQTQSKSIRIYSEGKLLSPSQYPLQRAAVTGLDVAVMELEVHVNKEAPPFYVLANATALHDAYGQPRGALVAVTDITAKKQAEAFLYNTNQRLQESVNFINLAQEAGHVGFFQYRFDDRNLSCTAGHMRLFGGADELKTRGLKPWLMRIDNLHRKKVFQAIRNLLHNHEEKLPIEYCIHLPDSSIRWLSTHILLKYESDDTPAYMIGVSIDVTEQKLIEQERAALIQREQAARLDAENANRNKDEFMAMLGHELRNPLGAITSAIEVLKRVGAQNDLAINAREIIARQASHLGRLMDDLLDVARVISGKILLARRDLDLAALVRYQLETMRVTGAFKQHDVEVNVEEIWINADNIRIEQIVTNLVTNALKYTPAGGHVDVRVYARDEQTAALSVRDTGIGMPEKLLPHIFDLFVQGECNLDRGPGGLGIGLTLVKRLVELHGGKIEVNSSSVGSTFTLLFPRVALPHSITKLNALPKQLRRSLVLIEDNEDALQGLSTALSLDGHNISTALDGENGLKRVLEIQPDVAIVDIGLPGLTGFEVAKQARAAGFTGRMIALSGYGQKQDAEQAAKCGFDVHMVKPVDIDSLRNLITA